MATKDQKPIRSHSNMLKNVALLSGMWGMGIGAAFVQIPAAQNVLVENGYASISTVPLGLIFFLSSPCAILIPQLKVRYGEKRICCMASILGMLGSILQMTGVVLSKDTDTLSPLELTLFLVGASIQSFTYASSNNLRFAVAYFSTREFLPKATALVLFGGVVSSLLGPLLSNFTRHAIPGVDYAGNFIQITLMYLVFMMLALLTDFESPPKKRSSSNECDILEETVNMVLADEGRSSFSLSVVEEEKDVIRPLFDILKETDLPLLTAFQCLCYNIMALYMSQVQLPMMTLGYSANNRTYVITAHMIGMFLPGLVSGHIINFIGTWATTFCGFLLFILGGAIMLINDSLNMFIIGMSIIGIGWNLSFVGPSAEVSKICTTAEKAKIVGFNDGIMLLSIGSFALIGSIIYEAIGSWKIFNIILMSVSGFSALIAICHEVKIRLQPLIQGDHRSLSVSTFDQMLLDQL